jgi:hypothetical protein
VLGWLVLPKATPNDNPLPRYRDKEVLRLPSPFPCSPSCPTPPLSPLFHHGCAHSAYWWCVVSAMVGSRALHRSTRVCGGWRGWCRLFLDMCSGPRAVGGISAPEKRRDAYTDRPFAAFAASRNLNCSFLLDCVLLPFLCSQIRTVCLWCYGVSLESKLFEFFFLSRRLS